MSLTVRLAIAFNRLCPFVRPRRKAAKLASPRLPEEGPTVYTGVRRDLRLKLDLSRHRDRMMFFDTHQTALARAIERSLPRGGRFIDVGASVGYFSAIGARRVGPTGRVVAFEPQPELAEVAREHAELNGLEWMDVVNAACGSEWGSATLHRFEGVALTQSSMSIRPDRQVQGRLDVLVVRLADRIAEPPSLLKIDVEGAEWDVLRGAGELLDGPSTRLLIELNKRTMLPAGYEPIDLVDWLLARRGYRMKMIRRTRLTSIGREALARILERNDAQTDILFDPI